MYLTHITTEGERWDQLAMRYYGDPLAYESIVAANPHVPLTVTLPAGLTLSIPVIEQNDLSEELPPWLR
ncbi:tail protein X [Ralstonia solanacearum]|uniref:tail protein X n=1 Tax=Ralstonia solanacearum TaxID=305 RepID=UPI0001D94DC6|nr:tail protein X [Ralstonia solanacearum]CBJ43021.1 putative bacteriophage tail fibre protein [Ralstonia solanacearum CFBP2957]